MPNPRLAGRYAKSLIDLAIEQNQLEAVYIDMQYLRSICINSPAFVNIMRSPVITADKKQNILNALTDGKISALTALFNKLLINKTREEYLPEIVTAAIEQYNEIKGIHKVKLTTATELSEEVKASIVAKIKAETSLKNIELETEIKADLIGGFVLEFDNNLVDASIAKELRDVKKQFRQNVYVHQIR
jgi:F-type H+-transporting ATPase subunit delta